MERTKQMIEATQAYLNGKNIERTKQMIEVMQAYLDGKNIEIRPTGRKEWTLISKPRWNFIYNEYRVKPESTIRPYESLREILDALKEHGPMIAMSHTTLYYTIEKIFSNREVIVDGKRHTFTELHDTYQWQDGTPCGVREE